jgi:hypothetical protein
MESNRHEAPSASLATSRFSPQSLCAKARSGPWLLRAVREASAAIAVRGAFHRALHSKECRDSRCCPYGSAQSLLRNAEQARCFRLRHCPEGSERKGIRSATKNTVRRNSFSETKIQPGGLRIAGGAEGHARPAGPPRMPRCSPGLDELVNENTGKAWC